MRPRRLLKRILTAPHNVRLRIEGSHHILIHPDIPELLNFQEVRGEVKPYQVKQRLRLIEVHNLTLREDV